MGTPLPVSSLRQPDDDRVQHRLQRLIGWRGHRGVRPVTTFGASTTAAWHTVIASPEATVPIFALPLKFSVGEPPGIAKRMRELQGGAASEDARLLRVLPLR